MSEGEELLRRLNNTETVSTSHKGTDAKWKLEPREAVSVLSQLVITVNGTENIPTGNSEYTASSRVVSRVDPSPSRSGSGYGVQSSV